MSLTLPGSLRVEDERDILTTAVGYVPTMGEALGAKVREGFDMTTTRMLSDEMRVGAAERKAYGETAQDYMRQASMMGGIDIPGFEREPSKVVRYNKADYEASPYFRKGVAWQDGWSEQRARIMAEDYDDRRYRKELLERRDPVAGLGEQVLGFGASLLGNLPDPINLIPFGAGVKGATLAATVGRASLEGAIGTAVADAIVVPDLKSRGEDVGFADAVSDVLAGAVLGGILGGAGYGISRSLDRLAERRASKEASVVNQSLRELGVDVPERVSPDTAMGDALNMRTWDGVAPDSAADAASLVDMGTGENFVEAKLALRTNLGSVERAEAAKLLESAIDDVAEGRAASVGEALRETDLYRKMPEEVRNAINAEVERVDPVVPPLERAAELEMATADIETVQAMREQGLVLPEEEVALREVDAAEAEVAVYEEKGLEIAECLWGAADV